MGLFRVVFIRGKPEAALVEAADSLAARRMASEMLDGELAAKENATIISVVPVLEAADLEESSEG